MPGRRRDNTIGQKKRRITFKQESFTGQNLDYPASDIGNDKLARLENGVARGVFLESRTGTERFSYAKMPGSGVIYSAPVQHPSSKKWAMHRGTQIWIADQDMHFWQEATSISDAIAGSESTLKPFNENFMIFNSNGMYQIHLQNTEYFKMNYECPVNRAFDDTETYNVQVTWNAGSNIITLDDEQVIPSGTSIFFQEGSVPAEINKNTTYYVKYESNTTIKIALSIDDLNEAIYVSFTATPTISSLLFVNLSYMYRYTYTFVRMLKSDGTSASGLDRRDPNTVVLAESGTKLVYGANSRDYSIKETALQIDKNNTATLNLNGTAVDIFINPTLVDTSANTIEVGTDYVFDNGMQVTFTNSIISPIESGVVYYVINASTSANNLIKLAASLENALKGTAIDFVSTTASVSQMFTEADVNADSAVTHLGIYRTLDIKGFDTLEGTGANPEVYSWVGDAGISDTTFTDNVEDLGLSSEILEGSFLAKMRGMQPLPSGAVGAVAPSWVMIATRNDEYMYYSSITELQKIHAGHYSPVQFHRYNQGIQSMNVAGDSLLVTTNTQTKPVTLTSFKNVGSLEYIPELDHYPDGDNTTGVTLYGTIAEIEKSTVIAVCSDQSVRIWNGSEWDKDLSWGEVNDEIKTIAPGAVGFFHDSVYYIWYRTDSTLNYNNKCLRLSLDEREGLGWSFFNGNKWVKPPLNTGPSVCEDSNGLRKFICLDHTDEYCYWLETYDSYQGSGLVKTYADKKIDGGFCELGNKYHYDDLDDNDFDTANLTDWNRWKWNCNRTKR